ncbi:ABC transporter ATP-binding protein [Arachnia propionica]|uniref:ABC transporter ATP-binding protein n=1 Tax=Arachnia propionica TaxID=1750 RepID=UPI0028F01087|nr:ABC transporter ATP-binding protein [Arachnia propionica]
MSLLEIEDLRVTFGRRRKVAVDGVSFTLGERERLGIIGQSGSGKTVIALSIMGLLPENARVSGSIRLAGRELVGRPEKELQRLRGDAVSMVFQEPMTALDPTMRVGRQVGEVVALHHGERRGGIRALVLEWLDRVGLPDPERIADSFPHQLSGGQRQRALIAMALANRPDLVICDEPTTALDVIVQKQILDLLDAEFAGRAALFVSHDLAVVRQVCRRVMVVLDGRIVEHGPIEEVIGSPQHPYTHGLVASARLSDVAPGERLPTVADYWQGAEE